MKKLPEIVELDVQPTAVVRLTVPRTEMQKVMGPGITELMTTCATQGVAQTGAWFTHHFRMDPEHFDFEIGVPVATPGLPWLLSRSSVQSIGGRVRSLAARR